MYIREFLLQDLRCFEGAHSVSLDRGDGRFAGWTVFAGRNGAGKSTLLKALALSVVGSNSARSLEGAFHQWVRRGGEPSAHVATNLDIDPSVDRFHESTRPRSKPFWTGLSWAPGEHSDPVEGWRSKTRQNGAPKVSNGPWSDAPKGWFIAGYGPYRHLAQAPVEVVKLSVDPKLARLVNLFHEASSLAEAVEWLKAEHFKALEGREGAEELKQAVLRFLGDDLLPDGSRVQEVTSEGLWIERAGVKLLLEQVSDGYRTVAALVTDILLRLNEAYGHLSIRESEEGVFCDLPGVVLIDEVDAHMHVAWQQRIGFWLTQHFPNIQFLVTTHSPFICQAASPRGLIRLPAPGEDRRIEHVDDATFKAITSGGADAAVLSELFGLDHVRSDRAQRAQRELATLEARVLDDLASEEEVSRYKALKAELPDDMSSLVERRLASLRETDS